MAQQSLTTQDPEKIKFSAFMKKDDVVRLVRNAVGEHPERFVASIISAVSTNPALQECDNSSIISVALLGQGLGLSPSPQLGHFYMVPYEDRKNDRTVAQFQLGYKGYIQLAMRTGQYADIDVIEVKEGEYKGRDAYTGKPSFRFIEDDEKREALQTVGYMAYFELLNGFRKVLFWTKSKMIDHADKYSPAFSKNATGKKVSFEDYLLGKYDKKDEWKYSSFWYKSFDEMAFKTMLRQLISKWGIMSIEMIDAFAQDASEEVNNKASFDFFSSEDENVPASNEKSNIVVTEEEKANFDFFSEVPSESGDA